MMGQQQGKLITLKGRYYYYYSHSQLRKLMLKEFENVPKIHD